MSTKQQALNELSAVMKKYGLKFSISNPDAHFVSVDLHMNNEELHGFFCDYTFDHSHIDGTGLVDESE